LALLPAFTRDVLHSGPEVFGYLRAAPGLGAVTVAVWLAVRPTAAWFGLVPAIVLGGVVTLAVAVLWAKVFFPMLWRLQTFRQLKEHGADGTSRIS
jgi:hypothetical protein